MKSAAEIIGLVFLCLTAFAFSAGAADHNYSLILAEYGKDSSRQQTQTLVRYHFKNGVMIERESLVTTETLSLRYDLGRNQIYDNRYVVTMLGNVVDLTTRQVLFKSKGRLIGIDQDSRSVVVRVERDDESGIYAFNLTTLKYRKLKRPGSWGLPGTVSPNRQLSASGDGTEIWLHRLSGTKVSLGSGFLRGGTFYCNSSLTPTFVWADDEQLLTQTRNGSLVRVDVEGRREPVVTIPDADPPPCGPELLRDKGNQIFYMQQDRSWLIDVAKRTFEPYLWQPAGNGFEIEYQRNDSYGHIIRYQDREIGRWWSESPATAPGYIAVAFGKVGSNLGYPEGVKVWSAENNQWTTIKPEWLTAIIGWLEE